METKTNVVTYQLAYLLNRQVRLCAPCLARDDHGLGVVGPVSEGSRPGYCDSITHLTTIREE